MTEILVGTKKGLFVLEGPAGGPFAVSARAFAGEPVESALIQPNLVVRGSCGAALAGD